MLKKLPFVVMTKGARFISGKVGGDRFASGKGGGKHSNFFVSGRIIYTVCFSVANLKSGLLYCSVRTTCVNFKTQLTKRY